MMIANHNRNAFTLVELLAVLVLLALMGAMVATATHGVTESARDKRTKKIIEAIDSVIQEKYQSFKYRPFSVEIPDLFNAVDPVNTPNEIGYEVLASEAARVRLMMLRDLQRMEIPDRLSDISAAPTRLRAAASPVVLNGLDEVVGSRTDQTVRRMFDVNWYDYNATFATGGDNVPSKLAAYRERIRTLELLGGGSFDFTSAAALANQGAECLYLIMATSYVGGRPAIDVIPDANIADTDGDGLLEILDGWGQPLEFVRWPIGYKDPEQTTIVATFDALTPDLTPVPDDFDLFRADYAYHIDPSTSLVAIPFDVDVTPSFTVTATSSPLKPWSMRPLIFSRGPDKASGVATNPWTTTSTESSTFSYRANTWNWPVNANYYGSELGGRGRGAGSTTYREHPYPDPYLRRFVAANGGTSFAGLLPGQVLSGTTAAEQSVDNLTNYQLQATPR